MLVLLITICILSGVHATNLERVHDEELLNLIKVEKYVIVLFSKFVSFFFPLFSRFFHKRFLGEKEESIVRKDTKLCIHLLN